jgi:hypothetical protein
MSALLRYQTHSGAARMGTVLFQLPIPVGSPLHPANNGLRATVETRYMFGPADLLRLESYRGAVRKGIYSDWSTTRGGMLQSLTPISEALEQDMT